MLTSQFIAAFKVAAAFNVLSVVGGVGSLGEAPEDVPIRSVKTDKDQKVADLKGSHGQFTALHFLTRTRTAECDAFVKEVIEKAPGLAGVRHVFIKADSAEEVKAWAAGFGSDTAGDFFADDGGKLALEYGLKPDSDVAGVKTIAPATIVLDGSGKVVVRAEGTHIHDHPKWAALSARIDSKRAVKLAEYNVPQDHLAVQGYDVVAYQDGKAKEGSAKFESIYRGVIYRFADAAHRAKFAEDPEKYIPTYGGWCASAMGAKGKKVEIDPANFKVKDGRLFLFYKDFFSDALKDWNKHEAEWEPAADRSWKGISGEATGAAAK